MTSTKTIIEQLKSVKAAKEYTYQDIVDMTAEIGKPVSMSTVRRVFGADSDLYDFRYDSTIQPIATVLLGIEEQTEEPKEDDPRQPEEYFTSINAMKSLLLMKNELIGSLNDQIDTLNKQADALNEQINRYRDELHRRNRTEKALLIALLFLVATIVVLVAIDLSHTGIGWFRGRRLM